MENNKRLKLKPIFHGKRSSITGRFMYNEMSQLELSKLNPIMVEEFEIFKETKKKSKLDTEDEI